MRQLRLLFLALFFILSTSASSAASVRTCCPDHSCDLALCIDIGCAAAAPAIAFDKPLTPAAIIVRATYPLLAACQPGESFEEVWTPPD